MAKHHLKRLAIPRSWELARKETKYIIRQAPGPHALQHSMPLAVVLRDVLGMAKTAREVRYLLQQCEVLVDGKRRVEADFAVGPMDIVSLPAIKQQYRIIVKTNGALRAMPIPEDEQHRKLCRITGKRMRSAKTFQLTLSDGRSMSVDAKQQVRVGDSMLLEVPAQKIVAQYPLADGAAVYLLGGSHCGRIGTVDRIAGNMVHITAGELRFQTPKHYVFVVGKGKPAVMVNDG